MKKGKELVLHVSADYPSPFDVRASTVAIGDVISASHLCYESAVLVPKRQHALGFTRYLRRENELHLSFFDPLSWLGIGVRARLDWVSIVKERLLDGVVPVAVHSHKLSYEAKLGSELARHFDVPHLVSIRGFSDTHPRSLLPWLTRDCSDVLDRSAANLWVSAWARMPIEEKTGYRVSSKDVLFPSAIPREIIPNERYGAQGSGRSLVCVSRLIDWRQKGIGQLIEGVGLAAGSGQLFTLDLIGRFDERSRSEIEEVIERSGAKGLVRLLGSKPREEVLQLLGGYDVLVMTSVRETFGLVYLEALFSGLPFIYRAGSGVDGHDFAERFGYRVSSSSAADFLRTLVRCAQEWQEKRVEIEWAIESGDLHYLTSEGLQVRYCEILNAVV